MASFLKASGIAIAKSALNCLREMAVSAVKAEAEAGDEEESESTGSEADTQKTA
jgi:hypothetical protein